MTFESDLYAVLSGAAGLNSLVGNRIVPSHEENPAAPYVVYTVIFSEPFYNTAGSSSTTRVRLQVDCYADHPDTAAQIAAAVVSAIPQTGTFSRSSHSDQDLGRDLDTSLYRRMVEFSVFHRT